MVQPFAFPKQNEACGSQRSSRRNRGTGTDTSVERPDGASNLVSTTSRCNSSYDRKNRLFTRKLHLSALTRKVSGQDAYSEVRHLEPKNFDASDEEDSRLSSAKKSPLQEIALRGQEIFWFILREELSSREKAEPGCLRDLNIPPSKQRELILKETIAGGSRTLGHMAQEFSKTAYRRSVRQLADSVDLSTLTYLTFSDLLDGLFQEGEITRERVLVLYFFCSDLALRAAYLHLSNQFRRLIQWISYFISTNLSVWVNQRGGWAVVLQESTGYLLKLAVAGFCLVGLFTCALFISKHCTK